MSFSAFSQFTDSVLLHIRLNPRRRGIPVPRNSLTCYTGRHLRIRRLILFIFAGAVYHNALTNCAARVCRACVDLITCVAERYLTLRTGCERHGRKNPLPFPYFAAVTCRQSAPDFLIRERQEFKEEGHSFNPRTAREQCLAAYGQTAGVPSFLPLRRAPHVSALRRAQLPLNRRRKSVFNKDFTRKNTLYLNLTNSRFCILQNFRKIIL